MNPLPRTSYPHFARNQVLKDSDLNNLVDYLEQQTRFTRTHLIGMGIACGLEAEQRKKQIDITISAGCGVTSEGHLIVLPETVLRYYQPAVSVPQTLFDPTSASNPTPNSTYSVPVNRPTSSSRSNFKVIELFTDEGINRIPLDPTPTEADRDQAAFTAFLANRILVVVWVMQETERDSCFNDCDNRGSDRSFNARFFLLPQLKIQEKSDDNLSAETLLEKGYEIDKLPDPWRSLSTEEVFESRYTFLKDVDPNVLRFGYTPELVEGTTNRIRLDKILNYTAYTQQYYCVCQNAIEAISEAFSKIALLFSPFFSSIGSSTKPFPKGFDRARLRKRLQLRLDKIVPESRRPIPPPTPIDATSAETIDPQFQIEAQYALQYFYDYLSQLVAAYRELVEIAFDLMADCCPETQRFPRFLLLGQVSVPNAMPDLCAPPSAYRSHFTQPPIYNDNQQRVKQVRHLYDRLVKLCQIDSFYLLPSNDTPLKITPSKDRSAPLSEQAIPYYLNYPNLYTAWSYDACRKGRSDRHPAYFHPAQNSLPPIFNSDLVFRHDGANFYRIEGHIGKTKDTAQNEIKKHRQQYNLPFDVITLKLGTVASLSDLNLSGHFDDLEADFGRMRDRFLQLWEKHKATWEKNLFLQTLKSVFFDQTSLISFFNENSAQKNLTSIQYRLLFNPVLALAADPQAYTLTPVSDGVQEYYLDLKVPGNEPIARFQRRERKDAPFQNWILSIQGSEDVIKAEKTRVAEAMSALFGLGKITYGLEPLQGNPLSFFVRFSAEDSSDIPDIPDFLSILTLDYFSINVIGGKPSIAQPEFQDFETLYSLLRDVGNITVPPDITLGNSDAAEYLNFFELKGLMESYKNRLEKLMELHLFYKFAKHYPGMEHLGGVPKGGTFVLVYVDGKDLIDNDILAADRNLKYQARTIAIQDLVKFPIDSPQEQLVTERVVNQTDMVIADFCLPYCCCSTSPSVSYLMSQPRPIVLLENPIFCEGDDHLYEFILDPTGGVLRGEGVVFENDQYYFRPSRIEQNIPKDKDVAITFTYVVQGSYDTFTVTVHPLPEATLSVGDRDRFCANDEPVPITLKLITGDVRLVSLTIAGTKVPLNNPVFDPKQYGKNEAQTVEIVAEIGARLTSCTNTIRQSVTVYPLPNTKFSLDPEREGDRYCAGQTVELQPSDPTTSQGFTVDGDALPGNTLELQNEGQEPIELTIGHEAKGEGDCAAQSTRTITVFPLPNADFRVEEDLVCSNGQPVQLTPRQPGGTFRALNFDGTTIPGAIDATQSTFIPNAVPMGEATSLDVMIEYEIIGEGGCSNLSSQMIVVINVPSGDFDLSLGDRDNSRFTVEVTSIRPENDGYEFGWEFPPGNPDPDNPANQNFRIFYAYDDVNTNEVEVTLRVRNQQCLGEAITKQIQVPAPDGNDGSVRFDRRLREYQEQFNQLGENDSLRQSRAYQLAGGVLGLDAAVPIPAAINRYDAFTKALTRAYQRSGESRKTALTQLMAISTARLFDRLITEDLAPDGQEQLRTVMDAVREAGVDVTLIRSVWKPDELRDIADDDRLNQLEALVAG